eukprot:1755546-Prymnesium_polylepis.2
MSTPFRSCKRCEWRSRFVTSVFGWTARRIRGIASPSPDFPSMRPRISRTALFSSSSTTSTSSVAALRYALHHSSARLSSDFFVALVLVRSASPGSTLRQHGMQLLESASRTSLIDVLTSERIASR